MMRGRRRRMLLLLLMLLLLVMTMMMMTMSYDDYENSDDFDYTDNGYADNGYVARSNGTEQVDFDEIKKQLISEVMGIYDEDKKKFMTAHEADKARILEELKQVKDENAALKDELNVGKPIS